MKWTKYSRNGHHRRGECGARAAFALREHGYGGPVTLIGEEPHPLRAAAAVQGCADAAKPARAEMDRHARALCGTAHRLPDRQERRLDRPRGQDREALRRHSLPTSRLLLATGASPADCRSPNRPAQRRLSQDLRRRAVDSRPPAARPRRRDHRRRLHRARARGKRPQARRRGHRHRGAAAYPDARRARGDRRGRGGAAPRGRRGACCAAPASHRSTAMRRRRAHRARRRPLESTPIWR